MGPAMGVQPKVRGLVSKNGKSLAGAKVELTRADNFTEGLSPTAVAIADDKGRFEMSAPAGIYMITAHAPGLFAYFGRNPIHLNADHSEISLPAAPAHVPRTTGVPEGSEGLSGTVLFEGKPVEGALVQAYLDAKNGFKGPAYAQSAPTGPDGAYEIPLLPGRYFITVRQRAGGYRTGPLTTGDLFGFFHEYPLALAKGKAIAADLELVRLPSAHMRERHQSYYAILAGIVTDRQGRPMAGFRPCLYDNPRMLDEPVTVGDITGTDGRFTIRTDRIGKYWLGAREKLGGPPLSGERMGFISGPDAGGITLEAGTSLTEIRIIVEPVP